MSIIEKAMEKAQQDRQEIEQQNPAGLEDIENPLAMGTNNEKMATPLQESFTPKEESVKEELVDGAKNQTLTQAIASDHDKMSNKLGVQDFEDNIRQINPSTKSENKPPRANQVKTEPSSEVIMANENAIAEGGSYRILKEYMLALRKSQPDSSVFMITSPMKGEGKTVVSANLACTLANEIDTTVLLIDADLRVPSCLAAFGIKDPPEKGLSDCLEGTANIPECLVVTDIDGLSILGAGKIVKNPAELITSKRMSHFLAEVKNRYPNRIIIIDSLPLLPFAESRALSRMVDGVMLVVREKVTNRRHLEGSLQQLQEVNFLGMIYNGATAFGVDKDIYDLSSYAYNQ